MISSERLRVLENPRAATSVIDVANENAENYGHIQGHAAAGEAGGRSRHDVLPERQQLQRLLANLPLEVDGPFGASSFVYRGGVTVTPYYEPPSAAQPGGSITTNDTANPGAAWYVGTVYGVHTIGCNPGAGTVACVHWYQIGSLDAGAPSLVQQGTIAGDAQYRFFPNLGVDTSGNVAVGYAYVTFRPSGSCTISTCVR